MASRIFFDQTLYENESRKVALAISGFILLYLLLFLFTIAVAIFAALGGIALIAGYPHFITLGIGISLALFGVFIVYFMIKFLFVKNDVTDPYRVEISKAEEPALFTLIENIAKQVDTETPAKVYLSHRVNACVFYNSFSFWSLFFPVKKNLEIGLGLFNTLNVSELSSIIAHEFGHFSQKSMKFGAYIYHANRVIYNMLYENAAWETSVSNIGNQHWTLKIFSGLSLYYAQFVKEIMQKVYEFINVRYMSLSRQMEFHADTIAVEICGSEPFKTAMLKVEWTDTAMNETLDTLNSVSDENLKSKNLFYCQQYVIKELAELNEVEFKDETITLKEEGENKDRYRPRVKIDDQWASHPLNSERLENAAALNISQPLNSAPCWTLLTVHHATQERLTEHLYSIANVAATGELSIDEFEKRYRRKLDLYSYPKIYNGYYNNRNIESFDLENIVPENTASNPFELLFKDITVAPGTTIAGLLSDIQLLKAIESESIKVKYFDFDGVKHEAYRSYVYRKQMEEDLEKYTVQTKANDKWVYDYCYSLNAARSQQLKHSYLQISALLSTYDDFEKKAKKAIEVIESIYSNMQMDYVTIRINHLRNDVLPPITDFLKKVRQTGNLLNRYPQDSYSLKLNEFLKEDYNYFDGATLFNDQFNHLNIICQVTLQYINHCITTETGTALKIQEEIYTGN